MHTCNVKATEVVPTQLNILIAYREHVASRHVHTLCTKANEVAQPRNFAHSAAEDQPKQAA